MRPSPKERIESTDVFASTKSFSWLSMSFGTVAAATLSILGTLLIRHTYRDSRPDLMADAVMSIGIAFVGSGAAVSGDSLVPMPSLSRARF